MLDFLPHMLLPTIIAIVLGVYIHTLSTFLNRWYINYKIKNTLTDAKDIDHFGTTIVLFWGLMFIWLCLFILSTAEDKAVARIIDITMNQPERLLNAVGITIIMSIIVIFYVAMTYSVLEGTVPLILKEKKLIQLIKGISQDNKPSDGDLCSICVSIIYHYSTDSTVKKLAVNFGRVTKYQLLPLLSVLLIRRMGQITGNKFYKEVNFLSSDVWQYRHVGLKFIPTIADIETRVFEPLLGPLKEFIILIFNDTYLSLKTKKSDTLWSLEFPAELSKDPVAMYINETIEEICFIRNIEL